MDYSLLTPFKEETPDDDNQMMQDEWRALDLSAANFWSHRTVSPDPKTPPPGDSQWLISEALKNLSVNERDKVYCDIHGVDQHAEEMKAMETPEFLARKLQHMELELVQLKAQNRPDCPTAALALAEQQNREYVLNPKFRLQFLRCEDFNVPKAAVRFCRHFDWKCTLFGSEKVARDITQQDMSIEDMQMLRKGYCQRLPARDRAGRAVVCLVYNGQEYHSVESLARQWFYMGLGMDEETDRRGVVQVTFRIKAFKFKHPPASDPLPFLFRTGTDMPVKWAAMHKIVDQDASTFDKWNMLLHSVVHLFKPEVKTRVRIHTGTLTESMYELMTFGIPYKLIPFTPEYKLKNRHQLEFLAMRQRAEELKKLSNGTVETFDLPSNRDVLLGKGKPIQESAGNLALVDVIQEYVEQYHSSTKSQKTTLASTIVQNVKDRGGRFVSKDNGIWMEVTDDLAREKVSHMFRHQLQKRSQEAKATATFPAPTIGFFRPASPGNKRVKT